MQTHQAARASQLSYDRDQLKISATFLVAERYGASRISTNINGEGAELRNS